MVGDRRVENIKYFCEIDVRLRVREASGANAVMNECFVSSDSNVSSFTAVGRRMESVQSSGGGL